MKKLLLPFFVMSVILLSCNNNDDDVVVTADQAKLADGAWVLTEWYDDVPRDIDGDGTASTDLFSQWNGCYKYSTILFGLNGSTIVTYTGVDNNPRCPEGLLNGASVDKFPWRIEYSEGVPYLVFVAHDYLDSYEIQELTDTTLVLKGASFMTCCDPNIDYFTDGYLKFVKQ